MGPSGAATLFAFGAKMAAVAYASANGEETGTNPKTWTAAGIGTAAANRYIVVGVFNRSAGAVTVSSVTVGGTACTQLVTLDGDSGANTSRADLWITNSAITSGTTADIVITFSGTPARHGYVAWAVTSIGSTTASATSSSSADPSTTTINISAGGVAIGLGFSGLDGTTSTPTGLTENVDASFGSSSSYTGLSKAFAAAQTGLSVGCDFATTTNQAFVVAALSP